MSLAALSISVLLTAQSIGLVPDPSRLALKGRKDLCESLAITFSSAAQRGDIASLRASGKFLMARNADVLSIGLRLANGTLAAQSGEHERHWTAEKTTAGHSTASHVQVPILRNNQPWGSLEVCFKPLGAHGIWGFFQNPVTKLIMFMASFGFLAYLVYLRRTLKYLDPSAVIPERVKSMLDTLAEGVLVLDQRERIVLANDAFAELAGVSAASLVGRSAAELQWKAQDSASEKFPWTTCLKGGETLKGTPLRLISENLTRALTVNCAPIHGVNGATRGALLTFDDVTIIEETNAQLRETLIKLEKSQDEIERQNVELQALASTDPLTGCRNRRSFYPELQTEWSAAQRYGKSLALVMLDVDHFKKINDTHGHSVGDQVLQGVSKILRTMARDTDLVCRYGGEEFCILLPYADVVAAFNAAERYRAAIEAERCGGVAVTASFGVSALHLGARDAQEILDQADKSLYAAKRSGRNRVVRWDQMPAQIEVASAKPVEAPKEAQKFTGPIAFHAVTALMSALDHRDKSTAGHSRRVADLCVTAARGLMSARECFILEIAALLHDIGKMGVPDSVLRKPGPLTEEEWKLMHTHDRMGVEILSAAFGSNALTEMVAHHHVWYQPKTPEGAAPSGEKIPLGARLLSIADAYDAMVSNRPYRKGRSRQEAFAELRRAAGTQFDPALVEKFIQATGVPDAPGAPAHVEMNDEKAIRIRLDLAKLAAAADCNDLTTIAEAARALAEATSGDISSVAERVATLQQAVSHSGSPEADLERIVAIARELQELCRSAESSGSEAPIQQETSAAAVR